MLPHRSKRYAGLDDSEIPRLKLATGRQLLLIGFMVTLLLVVVFPRKELVAKLYEQDSLDELSLSYIQNLYRANTRNLDVALLLARVQQDKLDLPTLLLMLLRPSAEGDLRQRNAARAILLQAYDRHLRKPLSPAQWEDLRRDLPAVLSPAAQDPLTDTMAEQFADLAFRLDAPDFGLQFAAKLRHVDPANTLEHYAKRALARGDYEQAARYYFLGQQKVEGLEAQRRFFTAGVDTLMAGGRYATAMAAARQHLGALVQDRTTLRYMARIALAAGYPGDASSYAKALVFTLDGGAP
jgi:hypothetical protein